MSQLITDVLRIYGFDVFERQFCFYLYRQAGVFIREKLGWKAVVLGVALINKWECQRDYLLKHSTHTYIICVDGFRVYRSSSP